MNNLRARRSMKPLLVFSFLLLGSMMKVSTVAAATLFLTPSSGEFAIGQTFAVNVRVDSEGQGFNAAQATIQFPKDSLAVKAVDYSPAVSTFNFWLDVPKFSNETGTVTFIGGTTNGVAGAAIPLLTITFITRGAGAPTVAFSDAAVTASDGSGTNILSTIKPAQFLIAPAIIAPAAPVVATTTPVALPPATTTPALSSLPPPPVVQITRPPVPTGKLPAQPVIKVPLYPNENRWSNLISQFNVSWGLPADITGVSTGINKQPNFAPEKSEGLFDNKIFAALSDGVWYLHVRFRNDVGWGPTAHYRLAVDTRPPLGFAVMVVEGEATDNPAPTLQFRTSDALSGLKEYQVRVGDGDLIKIPVAEFSGSFKLPRQAPGKQPIVVKAVDQADNGIEASAMLETIPIASPIITFVTKELFSDEEKGLTVKGTALPRVNILLALQRDSALISKKIARSDEKGNWEFTFDEPLRNGRYKAVAQSQDDRGALSLTVASAIIQVKSKPIIQIGPLQLGKGGAALFLLCILIAGFGGGIWFYKKRQAKLTMRVAFTESEISKIFQLIKADVAQLSKAQETPTTGDDEYALKRLQENIQKMEVYLKKGVEKIKK